MYESAYEIAASVLRYWFILLIVFILLKLAQNVRAEMIAERTIKTKAKKLSLGMLTVIAPATSKQYGKQFVLKRDNTIGRAARCDIRLAHSSVSSIHAAVYQKSGGIFLSDYGGKNGVYLNGIKLTKKDLALHNADVIKIGEVELAIAIRSIAEQDEYEQDEYEEDECEEIENQEDQDAQEVTDEDS